MSKIKDPVLRKRIKTGEVLVCFDCCQRRSDMLEVMKNIINEANDMGMKLDTMESGNNTLFLQDGTPVDNRLENKAILRFVKINTA
jgi:hypothetical protein